jgi:hypothetical protein
MDFYHFIINTDIRGNSILGFRSVFDAGICYFPKKKGISLLFCKGFKYRTPFQYACEKFGYDKVLEVVEDILVHYLDIPINMADALLSAAINEHIFYITERTRYFDKTIIELIIISDSGSKQ